MTPRPPHKGYDQDWDARHPGAWDENENIIEVSEDGTWTFVDNGVPFLRVTIKEIVAQFANEVPTVFAMMEGLLPDGTYTSRKEMYIQMKGLPQK